MKKIISIVALVDLTLSFQACNDKPVQTRVVQQNIPQQAYQEQYTPAPQTVVVHDGDSGASDMLIGMAVGSMLSSNGGGSSHTTHTTINKTYTSAPSTSTSSATAKPSYRTSTSAVSKAPVPAKPRYRTPVKSSYSSSYKSKPAYRSPTKKSYSSSYSKPRYRSSSAHKKH